MKSFFLFLLLIPDLSHAQNILIQAPTVSAEKYQAHLEKHKDSISFTDYLQTSLQKNSSQEQQLFNLGDHFQQNLTATLETLKQIQSQGPLTLIGLRYLKDITEKALAMKVSNIERQELLHLYCKSITLLNEGPVLYNCSTQFISLQKIAKKYPQIEKIFLESMAFSIEDTAPIAPQTPYQWTLVSNSHVPIKFYGTYEQLLNQHFAMISLVEGSCTAFSTQDLDFDLASRAVIYFSGNCVLRAQAPKQGPSWFAENRKTLLYTAGALLAGGMIYGMKDKKLVINAISFK